MIKLDRILNEAKKVAYHAALKLSENNRCNYSQLGKDIKSSADILLEESIIAHLKKHTPYPILTEESGDLGVVDKHKPYWI